MQISDTFVGPHLIAGFNYYQLNWIKNFYYLPLPFLIYLLPLLTDIFIKILKLRLLI